MLNLLLLIFKIIFLPNPFCGPVTIQSTELESSPCCRNTIGLIFPGSEYWPWGILCKVSMYLSSVITLCVSDG